MKNCNYYPNLMESELVTVREKDNCIMHRVFFLIFIRWNIHGCDLLKNTKYK